MNDTRMNQRILEIYRKCNIKSFPFSCFQLLKDCGFDTRTYEYLEYKNRELYELCCLYSEDAFTYKDTIYYNNNRPKGRIRFSLMHELGHIVLKHEGAYDWQEVEANTFASHILAPRIAIYYARCHCPEDVSRRFGLSPEASDYAYRSYLTWYRQVCHNNNRISPTDRAYYRHFYHRAKGVFVWEMHRCRLCGKLLVNGESCTCHNTRLTYYNNADPYGDPGFTQAEYRFLYGHDL